MRLLRDLSMNSTFNEPSVTSAVGHLFHCCAMGTTHFGIFALQAHCSAGQSHSSQTQGKQSIQALRRLQPCAFVFTILVDVQYIPRLTEIQTWTYRHSLTQAAKCFAPQHVTSRMKNLWHKALQQTMALDSMNGTWQPQETLEDHDENDNDAVLSKFIAYLRQFDQNEFRVDESDQPNELLRLNARPVKSDHQDPRDPRRKPRFQSRFCFLMVVGAMKCFYNSMVKVMHALRHDGFVTQSIGKHLNSE